SNPFLDRAERGCRVDLVDGIGGGRQGTLALPRGPTAHTGKGVEQQVGRNAAGSPPSVIAPHLSEKEGDQLAPKLFLVERGEATRESRESGEKAVHDEQGSIRLLRGQSYRPEQRLVFEFHVG